MQRGDLRDLLLAEVCQQTLTAHRAVQQTLPLSRRAALISAVQQEVMQARPTSAAPLKRPPFTDSQRVIFIRVITLWNGKGIKGKHKAQIKSNYGLQFTVVLFVLTIKEILFDHLGITTNKSNVSYVFGDLNIFCHQHYLYTEISREEHYSTHFSVKVFTKYPIHICPLFGKPWTNLHFSVIQLD